jgi:hypothetical protein
MFVALAISLLSAVRRDRFAVSSRLSRTSAGPELLSPVSGYSFEHKSDDPSRIVILSDEPERRISLMRPTINTSSKNGDPSRIVILASGESHLSAANVSQQEQLRGIEKVELSPVNTVEPERRISLMRPTIHMSRRMNTYTEFTRIPREMNTYANREIGTLAE